MLQEQDATRMDHFQVGMAVSLYDKGVTDYAAAAQAMADHAHALRAGTQPEQIWFMQHPAIYTLGARTDPETRLCLQAARVPWVETVRGGELTYHDMGQRMVYVMLDLRARGLDVRTFIAQVRGWAEKALAHLGYCVRLRSDHVGIWLAEGKVGSIGVHVRGGVTTYGMALNVKTDLGAFQLGRPCGLDGGVMINLPNGTMQDLDAALVRTCPWQDPRASRLLEI